MTLQADYILLFASSVFSYHMWFTYKYIPLVKKWDFLIKNKCKNITFCDYGIYGKS